MTAARVLEVCAAISGFTEEPGKITRTFLSPPMRDCHRVLTAWMREAGMEVRVDPVGNLRGAYAGRSTKTLIVGSHLDTVRDGGAYDGVLGVALGIALVEALQGRKLAFGIEVIGFSEEEGVRFGFPFIGSRALIGDLGEQDLRRQDEKGVSVSSAIRSFGLDPSEIRRDVDREDVVAYLEFHIEQGPVLEDVGVGLGCVTAIVGQSRLEVSFVGHAGHAGTTPMRLRRDALAGAAEWLGVVERKACDGEGLVATVGQIAAHPGVANVVPGAVKLSLDVRHAEDGVRRTSVDDLLRSASEIAQRRGLEASYQTLLDQSSVAMDARMQHQLAAALMDSGRPFLRMVSGAGHDAMILARKCPAGMLFLRSPGGISHHPAESVLIEDVQAALEVGLRFLETFSPA